MKIKSYFLQWLFLFHFINYAFISDPRDLKKMQLRYIHKYIHCE